MDQHLGDDNSSTDQTLLESELESVSNAVQAIVDCLQGLKIGAVELDTGNSASSSAPESSAMHPQMHEPMNPVHQGPNSIWSDVGQFGSSNVNPSQQVHLVLQQLLQVLRSPPSPQQQQQVLAILKANPKLMAAVIKHRAFQLQQQQQENQQLNQ